MKVINRISRDQLKKSVMNGDKEMGDFWRKDKEIIAMRLPFS